jgi:hypothetical protein
MTMEKTTPGLTSRLCPHLPTDAALCDHSFAREQSDFIPHLLLQQCGDFLGVRGGGFVLF